MVHFDIRGRIKLQKFVFNKVIWLILARFFGAAIGFVMNILIARFLGVELLGDYSLILAISSILSIIVGLGLPSIATIFIARFKAENDVTAIKGYLFNSTKLTIINSLLFAMVAFCFNYLLLDLSVVSALSFSVLLAALVLANALLQLNSTILVGLNQQISAMLPELIVKPLLFIALFLAIYFMNVDLALNDLIAISSISILIAVAFTYYSLKKSGVIDAAIKKFRFDEDWLKSSYPWIFTAIVTDFYVEVHIIVISFLANSKEIAILHILFRFRVLVGFGLKAINMFYIPKLVTSKVNEKHDQFKQDLRKLNLNSIIFSLLTMIFFFIFGEQLFKLFNVSYFEAGTSLFVLALGLVIKSIFGPSSEILSMHGHQNTSATIAFWCLVISLSLSIYWFEQMSIFAVVLGYTVGNIISCVILWLQALQLTKVNTSIFKKM